MFKFLEKWFKENTLDDILSCAKYIIDNGELVEDNSSNPTLPSVGFRDGKSNELKIVWHPCLWWNEVTSVYINDRQVPIKYYNKIFSMSRKRINYLQKKYLEETIKSVKK